MTILYWPPDGAAVVPAGPPSGAAGGVQPAVAHSLFVDLGNVYDDLEDVNFGDIHYTVGTGIRWKVESFVKTDLFLDYGYDIETGEGKFYGGTSLNF